jgi:hypothetical protein
MHIASPTFRFFFRLLFCYLVSHNYFNKSCCIPDFPSLFPSFSVFFSVTLLFPVMHTLPTRLSALFPLPFTLSFPLRFLFPLPYSNRCLLPIRLSVPFSASYPLFSSYAKYFNECILSTRLSVTFLTLLAFFALFSVTSYPFFRQFLRRT